MSGKREVYAAEQQLLLFGSFERSDSFMYYPPVCVHTQEVIHTPHYVFVSLNEA